jgi:Leu/Phe-tRNA-protein transferase
MTAFEWLEDCLTEQYPNGSFVWNTKADLEALFKRAKEMEKQQIIEAYDKGEFNCGMNESSEEYYNKTFNK